MGSYIKDSTMKTNLLKINFEDSENKQHSQSQRMMEKAINQEYQMSNTKVATLPNNNHTGSFSKKQVMLTGLQERAPYNVADDEYFDYEKQHKEIQKRKEKKENKDYCNPTNRMPKISMRLLDEAINLDILPLEKREKLIRNPNKYSIFFCKFNSESPSMRQAMLDKQMTKEELPVKSFEQFIQNDTLSPSIGGNLNQNYLQKLIQYLQYVTDHYERLKDILQHRSKLKKQSHFIKNQQSHLSYYPDSVSNHHFNVGDTSLLNRSQAHSLDLNRTLERSVLSLEERAAKQKLRVQQQENALIKYVDIILEKNKKSEDAYEDSLQKIAIRSQKTQKQHSIETKKKQDDFHKHRGKVLEKGKHLQEKKEDQAMNKFKRMDILFEQAHERKINMEKVNHFNLFFLQPFSNQTIIQRKYNLDQSFLNYFQTIQSFYFSSFSFNILQLFSKYTIIQRKYNL